MQKYCTKCKNRFNSSDKRVKYCPNCRVKKVKVHTPTKEEMDKILEESRKRVEKHLRKLKIQRIFYSSLGIVYKIVVLITLILILVK